MILMLKHTFHLNTSKNSNKTMFPTLLLTLFTFLTSAQEHGSPAGVPPTVTQVLPSDPPKVNPTLDPNAISFASWVDPNNMSPPTPTPESNPGDLYVCTDTQFTGDCSYFHAVTYQCYNLLPQYRKKLSSIRPDKNQLCIFFAEDNCNGAVDWMRWPGSGNMRGRRFDNEAASWQCTEDKCDGVHGPGGCSENPDGTPKGGKSVEDIAKGW
jgi:hypothetical protein